MWPPIRLAVAKYFLKKKNAKEHSVNERLKWKEVLEDKSSCIVKTDSKNFSSMYFDNLGWKLEEMRSHICYLQSQTLGSNLRVIR